jgi:hypothetical protein
MGDGARYAMTLDSLKSPTPGSSQSTPSFFHDEMTRCFKDLD